jgi:hypothetical protein
MLIVPLFLCTFPLVRMGRIDVHAVASIWLPSDAAVCSEPLTATDTGATRRHFRARKISLQRARAGATGYAAPAPCTRARAAAGARGPRAQPDVDPPDRPRQRQTVPLAEWRASLDRVGLNPVATLRAMQNLALVVPAQVEQHASRVLRDAVRLLRHGCDVRRMRKATFVDTYAKALEAHPALLRGAHTLPKLRAAVAEALHSAAWDPQTYTNGLCTAQMATAQATLQLYCKAFWSELEQKGRRACRRKGGGHHCTSRLRPGSAAWRTTAESSPVGAA